MRTFTYILILFFILSNSFAQVTFNASVNKTTVQTGERFVVEFKANTNFTKFEAPVFSHFTVLSGPNQSTSMQWINGVQSSSKSYTYYLSAANEGTFVIGEAKIEADGKIYSSSPIEIKVIKNQTQQPQSATQNQKIENADADLFIRAFINKSSGVVGEQFIATYKLYTRVDLSGIVNSKEPTSSGFWKEDVKLPERTQFTHETINGKTYNAATIKQIILFPQKSGKLTVDPLEVTFRVRTKENSGRGGVFDQFFGRFVEKDVVVKTNSLQINIEPLPHKGKPTNFSGGVGNFTFTAKPDKTTLKSNDAFNFTINIKGNGNIKLLEAPKVEFPADFEVYDPKIVDNSEVTTGGVSGRKSYEYLVIPRHSGDFTIPEIKFSYYDTKSKQYKTITQGSFDIHVDKGAETNENTSVFSSGNKENLKVIGKDIRYIHTTTSFNEKGKFFFGTPHYYLLLGFPFALLLLLLIARKKIDESQMDTIGNKKKKATKIAVKRLSKAKKHLNNNELDAFYEEVTNAVNGYFSDKFNIDKASINKEIMSQNLTNINVERNKITSLLSIIEKCEMARFAPIKDITGEGIYEEILSIISSVEEKAK